MRKLSLIILICFCSVLGLKAADSPLEALGEATINSLSSTSLVYILTNTPLGSAKVQLTNLLEVLKGLDNYVKYNGNQFASNVNGFIISIKKGPFLTNGNWFGNFTNQLGSMYLSGEGAIYQNDLRSLDNGGTADLTVGSVSYNSVILSIVGSDSVILQDAMPVSIFQPNGNGTIDLGYPTARWREFWISADAYIGGHVEATQYIVTNQPGLDRNILMYNTNGQGYIAISAPTNTWLPTNRFFMFITNPIVGQVLKILSVNYNNGVASIILTNDSDTGGSGLTTNANQFLGVPLSIAKGAVFTNITIHQDDFTPSRSLTVTNDIGSSIDMVVMLTTNAAGLRVTSNGAVVIKGNIGTTTNVFEVRSTNNAKEVLSVTHSNSVRIVGPVQSGFGATLEIKSETGSSQNNIELYAGDVFSGRWRSDSAGNQIISAGGSGAFFFNTDSGSGTVNYQLAGAGSIWALIPSSTVAAWHGGTLRRGQITNVWEVFVRSNISWIEVGGTDVVSLQSTNGMSSYTMFLPITNGLAGQVLYNVGGGELSWKDVSGDAGGTNARQFGTLILTNLSGTGAVTNIVSLSTTNATSKPITNHFENGILTIYGLEAGANITLSDNGSNIVITGSASGGGLTTNANQFGASVELTIKSGALLTNTLFFPSNLTAPAIIATATTAQVTNLTEFRSTNGFIPISISSNANAIVYGRLDMSNAVAFRTNNIDFRLPVYQAFTNALQTNLVLQLTNIYEGVTHRIDAYGAGRLGNGRTNAWQLLCTVAANNFIYWPPGTTNGNFDVLVNSNQIVSFTFMGGLGSTNILAAYKVLEGIGAN